MDWCTAMETVMDVDVPWTLLRSRLVHTNAQGQVDYNSTFRDMELTTRNNQEVRCLSALPCLGCLHRLVLAVCIALF